MLKFTSSETRSRGLAFWIVGFSLFVIAAIIVHAVWFYQRQREFVIERALTDAQNLASALEEHTRATVQWTDHSLESLSNEIEHLLRVDSPRPASLQLAVATATRDTPGMASFVYADARGTVIGPQAEAGRAPVNIANEDYFEAARASNDLRIHTIPPPWPANDTKMVIALVRPVHRPDGRFAGVVIGSIDPGYFREIHERLDLGKKSTVAIFSRDAIMIARSPYREDFIGTSFADDKVFQEISQSRLFGGHFSPRHRDGTARFVAFRTMPDLPFVVALGRAEDEVLTPLRESGQVALSYVVALIAIIAIFAALILALVRKQDRANRHLLATLDNVNQGVVVFDKDMRVVSCNQRYVREMFEFPPGFIKPGVGYEEILRYLSERAEYPGQTAEEVIASRVDSAALNQEQRIVHQRPNGKIIIIYRKPMADGGFIITFTDITEDIRIKEEAEGQAKLLKLVLDSIQQGIRVFDKDMNLVLANRRLVEAFGYPEAFAQKGATYESTVRISAQAGEFGPGDVQEMVSDRLEWGRAAISHGSIRKTPSGRYVKKQRDAIPGGGFVSTYTDVTELVHAEAEIARKSALLQLTQEHMGDGVSVYDEHLRLINFNERWVEIWGVPPSLACVGTSYLDIMHRNISLGSFGPVADAEDFIAKRIDALLAEKFTSTELHRPDGKTILIRRHAAPNGVIVINHTDITRLKQAEMEAERKSALLEAVLENMAQGIMVCDANMRVIAFNEKFSELQGYQPGDLRLGMTYEDFLHLAFARHNIPTDNIEEFIAQRLKSAYAREYYRREYQAHNGCHITLRRTSMPDGGFVMTAVDITDRKKTEMALQASEERYRTLVMTSAQLIWSTDAEGNVIEPQPTWQAFTGQADDDVMGWGWIRAVHPDDNAYVRRNWLMALESKSPATFECRLRRHDGLYRTFNARAVPVTDQNGTLREWVGICEDISDRKLVESEIAAKSALFEATLQNMGQAMSVYDNELKIVAYNQHFIDFFELPTGLITLGRPLEEVLWFLARRGDFGPDPERQVQTRVNAVRNKESYSQDFVQANGRTLFVSHTAMPGGGFINTFTDISKQRNAEQALQQSEERLRAVVENIADALHMRAFSRVDPAAFEPFDPRDSITAAVESMERQLALAKIDLRVSLPRHCGKVLGQPKRLRQVVANLLWNAQGSVTAHPLAGDGTFIGTIDLSMRAEEGMLRIRIAYSAGCTAPEAKEHVFGPFTGTGLGLPVSHGLVEAMNGKIDVAARPDGTDFTIILPLHKAKSKPRQKKRSAVRR